ncbi:hypothetical protein [Thiocapsa sp. N5-Cardenillas]|uniref:hypothetical protein n=1 Tax=Thiocapsa sp. N5-Cardenillas TaxID=3137397 RepID=UPI0035B0F486
MNKHQHFALAHYLREYNYDDSFTDVLTQIKLGCPCVTAGDDYASWIDDHLINRITEMAIKLAKTYDTEI